MMKDREYFVVAVTIAVLVPCIIGSFYFSNLYGKHVNTKVVSLLDGKDDIGILGENIIDTSLIKNEEYVYDFEVRYLSGKSKVRDFSLVLKDINPTWKIGGVRWKLETYDEFGESTPLSSGYFEESEDITLINGINIRLGEDKRYSLSLVYETDYMYTLASLNARIVLE